MRRGYRKRKGPAIVPNLDVEKWLAENPHAMINCSKQPGNLRLLPTSCAKRYITANEPRWANIGAEPFPIFVFKMNLIPCRNCETGAQMASVLQQEEAA